MPAPASIIALVTRFRKNRESYLSGGYNETQLRREFVDPFFAALGWDVSNRDGFAEAYKDVVHEDSIRIAGSAKSPDYSFRIGGLRKFFVETKKPAVNLKTDRGPAFQLRRYAWSAKLAISILTDFEEFAVYDTRMRPNETDKASKSRILYLNFEEYADRWDELLELFSPDGIRRGGLDRLAKETKGRRGTAQVDDEFLRDMEQWRESLAKNIASRNHTVGVEELNFAVQMTIDRIVFLRIAEDRGLEPSDQLKDLLAGDSVYQRLQKLFEDADRRYNSGLFHFQVEKGRKSVVDSLTPELLIDDKVLKDIIRGLYYPASPYEFSVFPADILGQVYEQFLGKVIRLTDSHRAVIEEKPDVKKAGGVYYTPTYVVRYIVEHTLGKLLVGRKPATVARSERQSAAVKILDPACGSGSFLLVAYQYLLDWHRDFYVADGAKKWSEGKDAVLRRSEIGEWRLTPQERKRILLDSIFGVDIDAQAVEVTKLSLLLKVLEGESQLAFLRDRALPDLDQNIKRGNSLLGADYGTEVLGFGLEADEERRLLPFAYEREFKPVFDRNRPGFDAVIGNPPYVLLQWLNEPGVEEYLVSRYKSAQYKINTYAVFTERAVSLLREKGEFGFITPSSYLRNKFAVGLREYLLEQTAADTIRVFQYPVFRKVSEDTCITIVTKAKATPSHEVAVVMSKQPDEVAVAHVVKQASWAAHPNKEFGVAGGTQTARLAESIRKRSFPLGDVATAYFGIQTHDRAKYVAHSATTSRHKPVIDGVHIRPFSLAHSEEFVDFSPKAIKSGGKAAVYMSQRIGIRQIGATPVATMLPGGLYTLNTIYNVFFVRPTSYDLRFVLGVIGSLPLRWYWLQTHFDQKKTFPKIKKDALLGIPIPKLDLSQPVDREQHDRVVGVVQELLDTHARARRTRTPSDRTMLERRQQTLQMRLDELIGALWMLTQNDLDAMRRTGTPQLGAA